MARKGAISFTVGGKAAAESGLAKRVGRVVSLYGVSEQRAIASLKRKMQPVAKDEITKVYSVRASKLNDRFRIIDGKESVSLWASSRKISLIDFQGSWGGANSAGATASIVGPKVYAHAFIATVQGLKAIRKRAFKDGKRVGRGPLTLLRGPSPFEMLVPGDNASPSISVQKNVLATLTDFYVSELRRQYALELKS